VKIGCVAGLIQISISLQRDVKSMDSRLLPYRKMLSGGFAGLARLGLSNAVMASALELAIVAV
jgi:hypothetical protein